MDTKTGPLPPAAKFLPKEIQIAKRIPRALELAYSAWIGSGKPAGYDSSMANAPAIADLAAYISGQLDGSCFSDRLSKTLIPKEKQVLARVSKAIEMASEAWEQHGASVITLNCGDVAHASAIAKLAVQIAKELEGFYPPCI